MAEIAKGCKKDISSGSDWISDPVLQIICYNKKKFKVREYQEKLKEIKAESLRKESTIKWYRGKKFAVSAIPKPDHIEGVKSVFFYSVTGT